MYRILLLAITSIYAANIDITPAPNTISCTSNVQGTFTWYWDTNTKPFVVVMPYITSTKVLFEYSKTGDNLHMYKVNNPQCTTDILCIEVNNSGDLVRTFYNVTSQTKPVKTIIYRSIELGMLVVAYMAPVIIIPIVVVICVMRLIRPKKSEYV